MSNYEVLSLCFLAVPILLTKIEINWLLSSNKSSSFDAGFIRNREEIIYDLFLSQPSQL